MTGAIIGSLMAGAVVGALIMAICKAGKDSDQEIGCE